MRYHGAAATDNESKVSTIQFRNLLHRFVIARHFSGLNGNRFWLGLCPQVSLASTRVFQLRREFERRAEIIKRAEEEEEEEADGQTTLEAIPVDL